MPRTPSRRPGGSGPDAPWQRCGEDTARRHLLLVLRQQDHHDRRGRHGGDRRRGAGRPHAPDVAARPLARRVGSLRGRRQLGLPDRRAGLQVQPDRHRRRDRHRTSSRAPRQMRRRARGDRSARYADAPRDVDEIELPPRTRTASTPGISSRSGCGSTGLSIDRNAVHRGAAAARASAVRCTGGRCIFTRTTRRRSAGSPTPVPRPARCGRA